MSEMDFYEMSGGDAAWNAWFELCSVARVGEQDAALAGKLGQCIGNAMKDRLARTGCGSTAFDADNPVSHFDAYFLLDSSRKEAGAKKPLKQFLRWKMSEGGIPLREVVCGLLFSRAKGYIKSIVNDWIATVRGWKCHTITQEDGSRKPIWENTVPLDELEEGQNGLSEFTRQNLSAEEASNAVANLFSSIENKLGLEKRKIALLLYVTANNGTLDNPAVLEVLEVKKSRAYAMRAKCLEMADAVLGEADICSDDISFAATLLASCEAILGEDNIKTLSR